MIWREQKGLLPLTLLWTDFPWQKLKRLLLGTLLSLQVNDLLFVEWKSQRERGRLHFQPELRTDLVFYPLCLGKKKKKEKKEKVRKLPTNNNVSCNWSEVAGPGPAVKAHYLSDNRPGALQMLANEAVCLSYLPSLKWKREGVREGEGGVL